MIIRADADCNLIIDGRFEATLYAYQAYNYYKDDYDQHLIQCVASGDVLVEKIAGCKDVVLLDGLKEQLTKCGVEMWKIEWNIDIIDPRDRVGFIDYWDKNTLNTMLKKTASERAEYCKRRYLLVWGSYYRKNREYSRCRINSADFRSELFYDGK